jgi:hypothetical protein
MTSATSPRPTISSFWLAATILFVAAYITINLFRIGGETFVFNLNSFVTATLAVTATVVLAQFVQSLTVATPNRLLWRLFLGGMILWTIAELTWAVASLLSQEVPYPSWADLFWMVGYLPVYLALIARIRALPQELKPFQNIAIWGTIIASVIWTIFFIIIPTVQESDPGALLENLLNVLYPLANLILLVLVLRLLFVYQEGQYGRAWLFIAIGFAAMSVADLLFTYATITGLYYPDGEATLLSTLAIDVPYSLSYLFLLLGFITLKRLNLAHDAASLEKQSEVVLVPNTHLLVFTKGDDTVIGVSDNFSWVFATAVAPRQTIAELLKLSAQDRDLATLSKQTILNEKEVWAETRKGRQSIFISGIANQSGGQVYEGGIYLLRVLAPEYGLDGLLTGYQQEMIRSLMLKTDTAVRQQKACRDLLTIYYTTHLQTLYHRLLREGGGIMGDTLITRLNALILEKAWPMGLKPDSITPDVSELSLAQAQEALPLLFSTTQTSVAQLIDSQTVTALAQEVDTQFGEAVLQNVSYIQQKIKAV